MNKKDIYLNQIKLAGSNIAGYDWLYNTYSYLDSIADGYCVISLDNYEEFISDAICNKIGKSRDTLGKTIEDLKPHVIIEDFENFEQEAIDLITGKIKLSITKKRLITVNNQIVSYTVKATLHGSYILSVWFLDNE